MQKRIFLLPLIIFVLCSSTLNSKAEFNISEGDEFQYVVQKWNWEAISGSNSSSFQGFTIDDHLFSEGDEFLVKVINMDDNFTVDYTIEKNGFSTEVHDMAFGVYINMLLIVGGPTHWFLPKLPYNETRIEEGPYLDHSFYPFYDEEVFDYFERRANSTRISSMMTVTYRNYTDIQITYTEKKGMLLYDQYLKYGYKYTDSTTSMDYISESNILYSIEKSTGVLHGFRMECRESGLFNGTSFDYNSEGLLTLKGYNMPKFNLGEYAGLPGISFIIVPITLAGLIMARLVYKKKQTLN